MQKIKQRVVKIKDIQIGNELPLTLIGGPCVIESRSHALEMAHALKEITERLKINFIYKSSFDKANRTSIKSGRGVGFEEGLSVLSDVKSKYGLPTITDVHEQFQVAVTASVVDILQIPALLCRQTDLITAAAKTGVTIQIKKGQFLAPDDIPNIIEKVTSVGNENVLICERGTAFGYHRLINDMSGLHIMTTYGYPVIFDGTHSVQEPSGKGTCSGGNRELVQYLCRAALGVGVAGLFLEIHNDPDSAPCDGPNMLKLQDIEQFLKMFMEFDALSKRYL